jgi:purine-cytosine permease-like protein
MQNIIAVFIPIVFILVTGIIIATYFYFRSRERQILIDKGLSAEDIKQFFESKKDPFRLFKIGIICVAFGIGLGLGLMLQEYTTNDFWIPFLLFTFTGIGFIAANLISNKLEKNKS